MSDDHEPVVPLKSLGVFLLMIAVYAVMVWLIPIANTEAYANAYGSTGARSWTIEELADTWGFWFVFQPQIVILVSIVGGLSTLGSHTYDKGAHRLMFWPLFLSMCIFAYFVFGVAFLDRVLFVTVLREIGVPWGDINATIAFVYSYGPGDEAIPVVGRAYWLGMAYAVAIAMYFVVAYNRLVRGWKQASLHQEPDQDEDQR